MIRCNILYYNIIYNDIIYYDITCVYILYLAVRQGLLS